MVDVVMRTWGSGEHVQNKSLEVLKELIQIMFENHDIILKNTLMLLLSRQNMYFL